MHRSVSFRGSSHPGYPSCREQHVAQCVLASVRRQHCERVPRWTLTCAAARLRRARRGDQRSHRIEAQADLLLAPSSRRLTSPSPSCAAAHQGTQRGFRISTIHDFSRRRGVAYKKYRARQRAEREDLKARREAWFDLPPELDPEKLLFLDETGATTVGPPARRRPRERCRAPVPHGHWKTTTLVAALRLDARPRPWSSRGDERRGVHRLRRYSPCTDAPPRRHRHHGHLPAHKVSGARAAIERTSAGCCSFRHTTRISTRSSRPSPRSRRSCGRLRRGRSRPSTPPSPRRSTPSTRRMRQLLHQLGYDQIEPKMPVEFDVWLTAPAAEAMAMQRSLPDDALRIVTRGERSDRSPD